MMPANSYKDSVAKIILAHKKATSYFGLYSKLKEPH
jgi:hypothetical protein